MRCSCGKGPEIGLAVWGCWNLHITSRRLCPQCMSNVQTNFRRGLICTSCLEYLMVKELIVCLDGSPDTMWVFEGENQEVIRR